MASGSITAQGRSADWLGVLVSFGLAFPLLWLADGVALAIDSAPVAAVASAAALFMTGFGAARLRPGLHPSDAGIGASATVLAVSIAEVMSMRPAEVNAPLFVALLSLAVAATYFIARAGARISAVLREHARAPR